MKTCSVGTKLFLADGQTNMTKLMVTFHNFVNALKMTWHYMRPRCI